VSLKEGEGYDEVELGSKPVVAVDEDENQATNEAEEFD
jgi:hypothetical protein